jgi:UDP-2,4-diacetamido-2,4,6-trideoxy-beta-L-altropyranose hydrolase
VNIAFRADASDRIGSGHVMRCLTLANSLREYGANCLFLCRKIPVALAGMIRDEGHRLVLLPPESDPAPAPQQATANNQEPAHASWLAAGWHTDSRQSSAAIGQALGGADWMVVDHYALDARWESALRRHARRILVIDDIADRRHDCDMLLDQNFYLDMHERYKTLVPAHCRLLLGPEFALLRPEFAALRTSVRPRGGPIRRLLVFMGGSDSENSTGTALEALRQIAPVLRPAHVDVIIGGGHRARIDLENTCRSQGWSLHVQTPHMAALMAAADAACGAGGSATWERCCLGLPTLAAVLADNQLRLARDAHSAGFLHAPVFDPFDPVAVARELTGFLDDENRRADMSRAALAVTDGRGAERLAGMMTGADRS